LFSEKNLTQQPVWFSIRSKLVRGDIAKWQGDSLQSCYLWFESRCRLHIIYARTSPYGFNQAVNAMALHGRGRIFRPPLEFSLASRSFPASVPLRPFPFAVFNFRLKSALLLICISRKKKYQLLQHINLIAI
jgi:hypothetical protein